MAVPVSESEVVPPPPTYAELLDQYRQYAIRVRDLADQTVEDHCRYID